MPKWLGSLAVGRRPWCRCSSTSPITVSLRNTIIVYILKKEVLRLEKSVSNFLDWKVIFRLRVKPLGCLRQKKQWPGFHSPPSHSAIFFILFFLYSSSHQTRWVEGGGESYHFFALSELKLHIGPSSPAARQLFYRSQ